MGAQENAALVRRGYEAFSSGDMNTLRDLFAEDAVWHVGGTGPLSEDKKGRDAILAYFGELGTRSNGSIGVTMEDVASGDRYTVGVQFSPAERDGKTMAAGGRRGGDSQAGWDPRGDDHRGGRAAARRRLHRAGRDGAGDQSLRGRTGRRANDSGDRAPLRVGQWMPEFNGNVVVQQPIPSPRQEPVAAATV